MPLILNEIAMNRNKILNTIFNKYYLVFDPVLGTLSSQNTEYITIQDVYNATFFIKASFLLQDDFQNYSIVAFQQTIAYDHTNLGFLFGDRENGLSKTCSIHDIGIKIGRIDDTSDIYISVGSPKGYAVIRADFIIETIETPPTG